LKVACPEEIAFLKGWIDRNRVMELAEPLRNSGYGEYLIQLLERGVDG
jgi:glucose-1-phosphate thymidylyltransferase